MIRDSYTPDDFMSDDSRSLRAYPEDELDIRRHRLGKIQPSNDFNATDSPVF
jgi:hypothetical protein